MEVTFVLQDGTSRTVEAEDGWKLMEVAVDNAVPGIDGRAHRARAGHAGQHLRGA